MIDTTYQGLHHPFHLQLEEEGGHAPYGDVGLYHQGVDVEVAPIGQNLQHGGLFGCEVQEEVALYGFGSSRADVAPVHGFHQLFGTLDEGGLVGGYQLVATGRQEVGAASGHGKAVAVVAHGQSGSDEGESAVGRFTTTRGASRMPATMRLRATKL